MTWLNSVKKGQKITADWANSLIGAVTDLQTKPTPTGDLFTSPKMTIKNSSGSAKTTAGILGITGMRDGSTITPTEAFKRFRKSGFQLEGGTPTSTSVVASLSEAIPAGKIGDCRCDGLVAAFVTFGPGSTNYTHANSGNNFVAAQAGRWLIVGKSTIVSNKAFCYLFYQPPVGHRTATLSSSLSTCPLLRSGESIPSGSVVVLSFNGASNVWQIIEAQCPSS